jgi:hypothetical protein
MSTALVTDRPLPSLSVPWRDPHTVPPGELTSYIRTLERACLDHPTSSDLRTVLGVAHAVNHDVPQSMEALDTAIALDPESFWAHYKHAELHYRLRALTRAEALTVTALNLATNGWQLSLARKQLQEIRMLGRASARNLSWKMPLAVPALVLSAIMIGVTLVFWWT